MAQDTLQDEAKNAPPCARCGQAAKLQCPKCLELQLPKPPSVFCSQDCFKHAWPELKRAHKPGPGSWLFCTKRGQARSMTMPEFRWTGPLRPAPISPRRPVPAGVPLPDYAETATPTSELENKQQRIGAPRPVPIRSASEIAGLRAACTLAREVLDKAHAAVRPGVTTDEIDRVVHEATVAAGAYPSPLNYFNFPKSVCTSVNEARAALLTTLPCPLFNHADFKVICHGIPDRRPLEDGDIVNVDVTAYLNGFHGDLNETYIVGTVDDASRRLISVTSEALDKAIAAVKPGMRYRDVGDIISAHVASAGFQVVKSYCGHGIGDLFHCAPNIPHYSHNKAVGVMKAGQTFTIEPMVNAGSWRDVTWPDGWTAATEDGKRSAQFEHTLLVTDAGCDVLTKRLPTSPPLWWQVENGQA